MQLSAGGAGDCSGVAGDGGVRGGLLAVAQHHSTLLPDRRNPGRASRRRPLAHRPRI